MTVVFVHACLCVFIAQPLFRGSKQLNIKFESTIRVSPPLSQGMSLKSDDIGNGSF